MTVVTRGAVQDLREIMALEESFPEEQRWSEDSWRGELEGSNRRVVVSRDEAGEVAAVATFCLLGDVVDLHRIVTRASARRQGRAGDLMMAGIAWACDSKAGRMILEVEQDNAPALTLYIAHGFREIATRQDYYGAGVHAAVLERLLNTEPDGEAT